MEGLALATTDSSRAEVDAVETTSPRLTANRRNAMRSTGPSTCDGKRRSSKNATRHGLLSRSVLLNDEDPAEFDDFERRFRRALRPVGGLEQMLAARVIASAWRLRRFERVEALMLDGGRKNWTGADTGLGSGFVSVSVNGDAFSKLSRYEAGVERALYRALHELERAQANRAGRVVTVPTVMDVDMTVREEIAEGASRAR